MAGCLWRRVGVGFCFRRWMTTATATTTSEKNGLVLGVYKNGDGGDLCLTAAAEEFNSRVDQRLIQMISMSHLTGERGCGARVLYGLSCEFPCVAVVSLGERCATTKHPHELINTNKQNVREAVAEGVLSLRELRCSRVTVDECDQPRAAAEGATLSLWRYDQLKKRKTDSLPNVELLSTAKHTDSMSEWQSGVVLAEGQNWARTLMQTPASHLTPAIFCQNVADMMCNRGGTTARVQVVARDQDWIKQQQMGALLAVAGGASPHSAPRFLELSYRGDSDNSDSHASPLVLVGKGVTFDSGGISLKPSANMDKMRADMGGAACVAAAIWTAARLNSRGDIHAFIPLCENMPGPAAVKPGDVVRASNGTTIQVDNTDAEGRLILADALIHAAKCRPAAIIDVATLTGSMAAALGSAATGVFANCDHLWRSLQAAGCDSGDRMWRMPLWQHYSKKITKSALADLNNIGSDKLAGACTAAAFLKEFVSGDTAWLHLDIAGVMENTAGEDACLSAGMTGRPTRPLALLAHNFHNQNNNNNNDKQ